MNYTLFLDLAKEVAPPQDGILCRTMFQDEKVKVVLFGFAAGHDMSEHTASKPAMIHFLQGEANVTLGNNTHVVGAGAWMHMPSNLPHSIQAKTPTVMLLLLLK